MTTAWRPHALVCLEDCQMMNLFIAEIHRSFKQLDLGLKANYLFQGFLWLFWKWKNSYSLCMLFIFLQRGSWRFLLTGKSCSTRSSVMLCQTHGLNQHIRSHTALSTGRHPTVTGFSYYAQSYSSDSSPAALFHSFFPKFCPNESQFSFEVGFVEMPSTLLKRRLRHLPLSQVLGVFSILWDSFSLSLPPVVVRHGWNRLCFWKFFWYLMAMYAPSFQYSEPLLCSWFGLCSGLLEV